MSARIFEVFLLGLAAFGGWIEVPPLWIAQVGVALSVHLAMEYRSDLNEKWQAGNFQTTIGILWRIIVRCGLFTTTAYVAGRLVAANWPQLR